MFMMELKLKLIIARFLGSVILGEIDHRHKCQDAKYDEDSDLKNEMLIGPEGTKKRVVEGKKCVETTDDEGAELRTQIGAQADQSHSRDTNEGDSPSGGKNKCT